MGNILSNDIRKQYYKTFENVRKIIEAFPKDKWLVPHGDEYYIPSRIAYHSVEFIDGLLVGGFKDPELFFSKLPFGSWYEGTAETLPSQEALLGYYDEVFGRAKTLLEALDDEALAAPLEVDRPHIGTCQMGLHMYMMRELAAHTGELNKMMIENGLDDIWVSRE